MGDNNKKYVKVDFDLYAGTPPYASELLGVFTPLLGWDSKRVKSRIELGKIQDKAWWNIFKLNNIDPKLLIKSEHGKPFIEKINYGKLQEVKSSLFLDAVKKEMEQVISEGKSPIDAIQQVLPKAEECDKFLQKAVLPKLQHEFAASSMLRPSARLSTADWVMTSPTGSFRSPAFATPSTIPRARQYLMQNMEKEQQVELQAAMESKNAGMVSEMVKRGQYKSVLGLLSKKKKLIKIFDEEFPDVMDHFDPTNSLRRVSLSPIGMVNLYREYFFELENFLGPAVEHVWVAPGSTVELVEIHSRKTTTDRFEEMHLSDSQKQELSQSVKDELSESIKDSNRSETKFGVGAEMTAKWGWGSAKASTSFNLNRTQESSREVAHKHMRDQSSKLSTDIRRSFKTSFRTITEVTASSSKRHVLTNPDQSNLVNFELRRKMRQVGIQVQDVGSYMCWQTYVDDPGRGLGRGRLVHLAKLDDPIDAKQPEATPMPEPKTTSQTITIPFKHTGSNAGKKTEAYMDGVETDLESWENYGLNRKEGVIALNGPYTMVADRDGYEFESLSFDAAGACVELSQRDLIVNGNTITFKIYLDWVNFEGANSINVVANARWTPTKESLDKVSEENKKKLDTFTERTKRMFLQEFYESAKERVTQEREVSPRPFPDLREEERIVVYRALIQDMLTGKLEQSDDRTRHVVAELIKSIFDVEKMLYYVAPEWWRPRERNQFPGNQTFNASGVPLVYSTKAEEYVDEATSFPNITGALSIAGRGTHSDDYPITDASPPAKLGSSLGWKLQIDGDDLRNAFLNAPWVKAVLPIRPGKEKAALAWLSSQEIEGTDGLDHEYQGPRAELDKIREFRRKPEGESVTLEDALYYLADQVETKHQESINVLNQDDKVASTPVEYVYENGFDPLKGGFKAKPLKNFEVFDQWVEVLPTDQMVPVKVEYDPKTGRLI